MKLRQRPLGLFVLVTAVLFSLTGATTPINPLVTRRAQPAGPAPAECAEALTPAPLPRVDVQNIPLPQVVAAEATAPPSRSLRAALQATQTALTQNDRPEFNVSLEAARSLLRIYPTGAERRSGEELVRIYETAARLWDAQYESPFFDQTSPEYAALQNIAGYEEAVRRSVLVDPSGRRYYPAAESRDFLGRVAADRLGSIGIQAPAPRSAAPSRPRITDPRPQSGGAATPAPVAAAPQTSTPAAANTPAAPAPTSGAVGEDLPDEPETPDTATAGVDTPTTDTPATDATTMNEPTATAGTDSGIATATDAPAAPEGAAQSRTRSVVLPTILILIGLGVLIVLFRASK
ncbi:MAG TPA: hypothetical protein VF846_01315 [Thermoanaerobaculia bacterium]|jgi:hypothetical protein